MALALKDRVKETTTTTGTGTVTLAGAAAGFQSFAAVGDGNQTFYAIVDSTSGDWEVGIGTYTSSGTTLSRTTVVSSSNAGSLVNFGAGSKDVFVTYPSSRAVYLDAAGSAVTTLDIGTLGTSTANISTANITAGTVATAPVNNTDIVNKEYADAIASGIHFHEAVNLATTAALPANTYNNGTSGVGATLTGNANGALSVDSTLTIVADRILVKNEVAGANNGVYVVTQVGSAGTPYILTRSTDMDSVGTGVDQIDEGDFFLVTGGTANVNTAWVQQTPPPITIGTTPLVFQQFSAPITYTAGTGLSESPSYTFNIANIGTAGTYGSASSVPVITTNAQGQVTGVTPTAISISGAAVSGNISGSAGSVANALTAGTYLTSGGTFDGSAARTFAVDATDVNTASKVVARDASGNFSAGTITATLSGAATSATTATNLAGGAANRIAYQTGAGATTFAVAPTASNQVLNWNGSAFTWSAGTISGIALGSNLATLTFGTYLTGTSYNGSTAVTLATNATNANTASTIVARDASGNFTAGTITAALNGNASTATSATSATSATTATNLAGGSAGTVPYQSAAGTTAQLAAGTSGQVLRSNGAAAPSWVNGTISGVSLGNNLNTLTMNVSGTGLSGSNTYNGSGAATFTVTSNATNANTVSTIVARDSNGDFLAGGINTARGLTDVSGFDGVSTSNSSLRVANPGGASYYSSNPAGAIEIKLPASATGSMFRMTVRVFTYDGQSFDICCGAYIYSGGVANQFAYMLTGSRAALNTRWGWDGSRHSFFIGNIGDSWQFPVVSVTDVQAGYQNYAASNWQAGWTVTVNNSSYGTVLAGPTLTTFLATTATTVTNLAGGSAGTIPYQSAAGTTVQLAAGTSGQVLRSNGAAAPSWLTATNANTANAIVARDSNGDFNAGAINITRGLTSDPSGSQALRVVSPGSASFYTSFASGALQIQLPSALGTGQTMLRMRISVWTFDGQSFDIFAGAYLYNLGVINNFAYMLTGSRPALNTRWGWDGSRWSFFIGDIGNTWSYPVVNVTDVQVGYQSYTTSIWTSGWNIQANNSSYGSVYAGPTLTTSLATTATTATTASNLAGGSAGTIPYQSAAGTTVQLAAGSSGQFLRSNGAAAPSWAAVSVAAATPSVLGTVYAKQDTSSSYQAFGYLALNSVTSGTFNTAVGQQALQNITSGNQNTAVGHQSIFSASSSGGANNTAIGYQTLWSNSSGSNNLAGGLQALYNNTTGSSNIAEGFRALYTNTTSSYNLGIGYEALYNLNSSSSGFNTVVGYNAGRAATQSSFCSIFGTYTAQNITSGSNNTVIGTYAGNGLTTGSGNVIIGSLNSSGSVSTPFNVTTESNRVVIGTASTTNAYVQVAWTVMSDARDKTDFAPVPHGLDFVTKLKPTAYRFKESRDATEGHGPLRYGFKAQDILELEGDNPVVIDAGTPEKLYFNDQNLLAILVKAVQEQQVIIDQLKADVAALKGN